MTHTAPRPVLLPVLLLAATAATARPAAAADQLVAFDEVFTIVQQGDGGLEAYHHRIDPKATEPASWVTPVNYSKGTAYLYLEVLKKPSARKTILTMCFDGDRARYGCIDTNSYTATGVVETTSPMAEGGLFWNYNQIAWNTKRGQYHIVVKDPALGGTPGGKPATDFTPTMVRLVLTVVPPGGTYMAPARGGSVPAADGGAPVVADAAASADAGGTGGSGGGASDAAAPTGGSGGGEGTPDAASAGTGGSGGSGGGGAGGSTGGAGGAGGSGGPPPPTTAPSPPVGGCALVHAPGGARSGALLLLLAAVLLPLRRLTRRRR